VEQERQDKDMLEVLVLEVLAAAVVVVQAL
jgi:hypothetical protein